LSLQMPMSSAAAHQSVVPGPSGPTSLRLLAKDQTNDLALLKSDLRPTKFAQLRRGVRRGEQVVAFGYPLLGLLSTTGNFTLGNVTSLTGLKDDTRYLQLSTPVQPGNSGGPLLDGSGNFVGAVSAKLNALLVMLGTDGDIPQNVNFAIKSSVAATFLESNGVSFSVGAPGVAIPPADLADIGKAISIPCFASDNGRLSAKSCAPVVWRDIIALAIENPQGKVQEWVPTS